MLKNLPTLKVQNYTFDESKPHINLMILSNLKVRFAILPISDFFKIVSIWFLKKDCLDLGQCMSTLNVNALSFYFIELWFFNDFSMLELIS